MKRGLLFILLIVFGLFQGFAQQYEVSITGKVKKEGDSCADTHMEFYLVLEDGSILDLGRSKTPEHRYEPYSFGPIKINTAIRYIEVRSVKITKNTWRNCKDKDIENIPKYLSLDCDKKTWTQGKDQEGILFSSHFNGDLTVKYKPLIELIQPSKSIIGYDDTFTVSVASNSRNFQSSVYYWQYAVGNPTIESNWSDMPNYTFIDGRYSSIIGRNSFSVVPNSFLEESDINKRIYFRIAPCNGITPTDLIYYDLRKSAPKIIGSSITGPECYDSNGSVRLYFNRQLVLGDKISYVLSDTSKVAGGSGGETYFIPIINENNITSFQEENGNYFIELNGVPPSDTYLFEMIGFGEDSQYQETNSLVVDSKFEGKAYYTDGRDHSTDISIGRPKPVDFSITNQTDVICNGQSNGTISIQASGGTNEGYEYQLIKDGIILRGWTGFSSINSTVISGLPYGEYGIRVRDSNACVAKEIRRDDNNNIIGLGNVKELYLTIEEPSILNASLINLETKEPRAYGFTDGVIAINIRGGNHNNSGYTISWLKDGIAIASPNVATATSGSDDSFLYTMRLLGVGAGRYTARITDSKGCETSITKTLNQPEPLKLNLSIENPISCNSESTESLTKIEDGHLKAMASGGVGKYIYTWKKLENGLWRTLYISPTPEVESVTTGFIPGIGAGTYAVNIKDENGIILGEYVNNILVKKQDQEFVFKEPDPIVVTIDSVNVFCKGGNNAWIEATIEGGTLKSGQDYHYQWSSGETTERIENIIAGEYILTVTDSNGCFEIVSVTIDEPDEELQIELFSHKQPKANGLTDGYIQYKISGGTSFENQKYTYDWTSDSGSNLNAKVSDSIGIDGYFIKLNNIGRGAYFVTITDANYSKTTSNIACITSTNYFLNEPKPLELTVEETKVISCNALNDYGNPFSDGALTAHASGGVKLQSNKNKGLPYYYTWKKKDAQGVWQVLTNQMDSIAINLDAGEYAVNIKDANGVVLGTYGINNQLKEAIDTLYTLKEPPLLEISTTQQNVYCFAGSDGWGEVHITGGTAPYTIQWSNGDTSKRATDISVGTYQVHVKDARGCEAITEVIITEPEAPVIISYPQFNRPTHIGSNDAWIEAVVLGGTSMEDGTYTYTWEDEQGKLLNDLTTTQIVNGNFVIRLNTITAGSYYLTVQDKNYDIATTKAGCTHAQSSFVIYEPIEATIAIETPISCNSNNQYQDPFSDGSLVAHIKGGVPFETGLPYIYHWKRQNESGDWEDLTDQLDSIAINLKDGNYALNVEDSRGTVMGTYMSDNLSKAIDSTFYFKEPDMLEVSFTTTEVNCDAGNDGTAKVNITGGVPPYDIKWSNGETTQMVSNLIGGTYFVYVTDSRGCEVSANVIVAQPGGLHFDVITQKNPTCSGGNDGAISINVVGGISPYQYQWNTGAITNSISNLSEGKYTLKITDGQGCIAFKEVVLEDPEPIEVNLGEDRSLCDGQQAIFDVSIEDSGARYYWESDNGFTSTEPKVTISKEGIYNVTVTSSFGCIGTDQIEIKQSNASIDADFLITSQAFVNQEVVLVNVSSPLGEGTEWHVPDGVTIVSQSSEAAILKFKEVGSFEVRLRTVEGDCYQDYTKKIVVEEPTDLIDIGDAEEPFLKKFLVHPNPSRGNFTVEIQLSEVADLSLRMINLLTANISDTRLLINSDSYSESYNVTVAAGVYILLLETPKGVEIRRVIIK